MDELPSFIQKDIYDKINHIKELLTKNIFCKCSILELIKCKNCKHIICPNCDEQTCQICKKFICLNCLNYKKQNTGVNLSWFACNNCKHIELYNNLNKNA